MRCLINKVVLFFSAFLCFNLNILAAGFGYSAPTQPGGSGNCLSQWGGCWTGASNKAYRLTLVDFNGKKIAGTKSVDFSSLDFYNCENGRECNFSAYSPISGYYDTNKKYVARYAYKYTKNFVDSEHPDGDYNIASESNPFLMVYDVKKDRNFRGNFHTQEEVNNLVKYHLEDDFGYKFGDYDPKSIKKDTPVTFLDLFLLYCGFMPDKYTSWTSLPEDKQEVIRHSTVIFEPTYSVYFYYNGETVYRYGTATELAQYMIDHPGYGLDYGVSKALRKNIALCVNKEDKKNNLAGFEAMKNGVNVCQNNDKNSSITLYDLVNTDLAYGLNVAVLPGINDCITGVCEKEDNSDFSFDLCGQSSGVKKTDLDGKSSYSILSSSDTDTDMVVGNNISLSSIDFSKKPESLMSDVFKVSGDDASQSVYCFDSVEYNFEDLSNSLHRTFNKFTFVNPEPATLDVTRQCLLGTKYDELSSKDHLKIDMYKDSAVELSFYDSKYHIYPSDSVTNNDFVITDNNDKNNMIYYVKPKEFINENVSVTENTRSSVSFKKNDIREEPYNFTYVSYSFKLNYVIPNDLLFIGEIDAPSKGYIKLNSLIDSFGYSKKFLSNTFLNGGNASEYAKTECPINYDVDSDTITSKTNIKFRVIDLNNPFPGRDGSARMPAVNWLYYENNIYNYITTGRGPFKSWSEIDEVDDYGFPVTKAKIDPELMYKYAEPMYTITLTPSTMLNIRKYNKTHSYYSMYDYDATYIKYKDGMESKGKSDSQNIKEKDNAEGTLKLRCNEEGRECYSEFLRNVIPQDEETISGTCFMGRNQKPSTTYNPNIKKEFYSLESRWGSPLEYDVNNADNYRKLLFDTKISSKTGKYDKSYIMESMLAMDYGADVNQNGLFDSEDVEIMTAYAKEYNSSFVPNEAGLQADDDGNVVYNSEIYNEGKYSGKLIKYYTCANKTYKSGGPVKEEE